MLAKKFGFGFGIAVILPILIHYGVSTFCPAPKWNDYNDYSYYGKYQQATPEEKKKMDSERNAKYDAYANHRKVFERNLFCVATPLGIGAIIAGSLIAVQAVGAGLIFGGIFTLVDGYCWYWSELQDWMRFLSLLAAFIVLVYMGYMKLQEKK